MALKHIPQYTILRLNGEFLAITKRNITPSCFPNRKRDFEPPLHPKQSLDRVKWYYLGKLIYMNKRFKNEQ